MPRTRRAEADKEIVEAVTRAYSAAEWLRWGKTWYGDDADWTEAEWNEWATLKAKNEFEEPGDLLEAPFSPAGTASARERCPSPTQSDILLQSAADDVQYQIGVTLGFGKHSDKTILEVHRTNPDYLRWLVRKVCARFARACVRAPALLQHSCSRVFRCVTAHLRGGGAPAPQAGAREARLPEAGAAALHCAAVVGTRAAVGVVGVAVHTRREVNDGPRLAAAPQGRAAV